jgi:acetylornithine deacetylase
MDVVACTRQLVDIESISGNEGAIGDFLSAELTQMAFSTEKIPVAAGRSNVYGTTAGVLPEIVFSTHMDTVPPFIASSEDEERIYGRGSCDAKGIIAAQIAAALRLRRQNKPVGLLFLVGEERDSLGAKVANGRQPGSKFLINGEPTENRVAVASKGALRVELIARGRMAHSAYPEFGESAIDKLLEVLARIRKIELPGDPEIGRCSLNIGVIEGGRAPNVVPDHAKAELLFRMIGPSDQLRAQILDAARDLAAVHFVLEIPCIRLQRLNGLPSMVASFTTDIPALTNWGQPLLVGPGSIHVAHTEGEYVEKKQLRQAVDLYCSIAERLLGAEKAEIGTKNVGTQN